MALLAHHAMNTMINPTIEITSLFYLFIKHLHMQGDTVRSIVFQHDPVMK